MDSLLLVNGCSCDSLLAPTVTPGGSPDDGKTRLPPKSFSCTFSELENFDTGRLAWSKHSLTPEADHRSSLMIRLNGVSSSPIKRPRMVTAANSSPLLAGSEATSTEDVWQAFNGFLNDDLIITTCQEEPGVEMPSTNNLSFSEFVKRYNELSEWLGRIQQSITTTVGVSKAEVYLHQTVHADLVARQADRRSLTDYGRQLLAQRCGPLSDPAMQREILGYMQSLAHRWQVVERALSNVSGDSSQINSQQPPSIDQVFHDLEDDLELLRNWLDNTEESLSSCRLPPSCSNRCGQRTESEEKHMQECASLLFERCKSLQVQIQSQQRFVSAIRRLSDRLASGSQEFLPSNLSTSEEFNGASSSTVSRLIQEKADAYREVAEQLENRWQELWLVSLEVHCRLENILSGESAPRSEIIRPISGNDLFGATYSESHSSSPSGGSRSPSSSRSIGFTSAFAASSGQQQDPSSGRDTQSFSSHNEALFRRHHFEVNTTASNSLDILPFSENEYEHIGNVMESATEYCQQHESNLLRRTHSEADCSLERTPVKKDGCSNEFGVNSNNYSSPGRAANRARRARSETYGSQYQMYFAVSDDSEGHCLDELATEALSGRMSYSYSHQLQLTMPRTASSDSPLPTSADFISTNDTPSSGSGGGARLAYQKTAKRYSNHRRSAKKDRRRRYQPQHSATANDISELTINCLSMQRSSTYNENLVREIEDKASGRASSTDMDNRVRNHRVKSHNRSHRFENSHSSSFYSSSSDSESGCSADVVEANDRLHSTDAVRAAMHRFRWKYCRRSHRSYNKQDRSSSLNSVDAAHKFSISESAIQELHEIYEAYKSKYSTTSMIACQQVTKSSTGTTATTLSSEEKHVIGAVEPGSERSPGALKQAACRSWESENSSLNKNWKRLITLGRDVAADANFDMPEDEDAAEPSQSGLLAVAQPVAEEPESSDGGVLSSTENREHREDVDWDTYQPPVYAVSSSDEVDEDIRRARILLSDEALPAEEDNFLMLSGENDEDGDATLNNASEENLEAWSPPSKRRLLKGYRLTSLLEYSAASLDEVSLGLGNIRLALRTSNQLETLAAQCRHLLQVADDNLVQLQEVQQKLASESNTADLAQRLEAIVSIWQRTLADLMAEQRRADDLIRAADELQAINDLVPALEQRLGYSVSSAASSTDFPCSIGIFRFDSPSSILEASEESLRVAASIAQLQDRATSILDAICSAGNQPLQNQVSFVMATLERIAGWNMNMRLKSADLYTTMSGAITAIESCESELCSVEKSTNTVQSDLSLWATSSERNEKDDERLVSAVEACQRDLARIIEPSLVDLESRIAESLSPGISKQSMNALKTRVGAIRSRIEAENGRLDTLLVAISLASSSVASPAVVSFPKVDSKDCTVQTATTISTSVDAQTLPEEHMQSKASAKPPATRRSWFRRFAKLIFPAQLAIVSIFLILRFLEPIELPIRVTPLLNFNNGPPPI